MTTPDTLPACGHHGETFEHWAPIPEFLGQYEASCIGRIRSIDRVVRRPSGFTQKWRGQLISTRQSNRDGYRITYLRTADGVERRRTVHTLVAAAFYGPRPEGMVTRHLNGDSLDNRVENLRHGTAAENAQDTVRHGRNPHSNKTHCPQGHEYTPSNTATYGTGRKCLTCARAASLTRDRSQRATCECGLERSKKNLNVHRRTAAHLKRMAKVVTP